MPQVHTKSPYANPKDALGINKVPFHLVPAVAVAHEAMAMWTGAVKYGPYNWRDHPVVASIYIAAERRHTQLYYDGEEFAEDGVHHLGHARACLGIILDAQANGTLIDDRPTKGSSGAVIAAYNDMLKLCNAVMAEAEGTPLQKMAAVDWEAARALYYDTLSRRPQEPQERA